MVVEKKNALMGTLVADAASMGLHWLYEQQQIATIESTGSILFRQPDANVFAGRKAYFAHAGRRTGQLSHYGESARLLAAVCARGTYTTDAHRQAFFASFGPCGSFQGYADRPTRALLARMITEGDDLRDPSGSDDDQMPGLCPVAGLFARGGSRNDIVSAVGVISIHQDLIDSADIVHDCLERVAKGERLKQALRASADSGTTAIHALLQEALSLKDYQPLEAANHFGMACQVRQGLPVVWHILSNTESFEMAVLDNIRCGGDSCGRAMSLGALAGLAFGIPAELRDALDASSLADL